MVSSVIAMGHNCSTTALGSRPNKLTDVRYYQGVPANSSILKVIRWKCADLIVSLLQGTFLSALFLEVKIAPL